jgi:hypothetical protein
MGFAIDLHIDLIDVPFPVAKTPHPAYALPANIGREQGAEPVPPQPDRLVAKVDAALEQKVFDVPQGQRKSHIEHDDQADHFG